MLVLTRKSREQIQIGDNVVITILRVKGQSVRIGVEAPRDVRVLRSELPKNEDNNEEETAALPAPETVVATPTAETSVAHTPLRRSTRTHSAHGKTAPRHKASPVWTPAPTPATLSATIKSETKSETTVTMFGTKTGLALTSPKLVSGRTGAGGHSSLTS